MPVHLPPINERLECVHWDTFWVPPETRIVERPELLYITTPQETHSSHLNIALRIQAPSQQLPELVEEVHQAHAATTSRWAVLPNSPQGLLSALHDRGYTMTSEMRGYTVSTKDFHTFTNAQIRVKKVTHIGQLRDWYDVSRQVSRNTFPDDETTLRQELDATQGPKAHSAYFVAYDSNDEPVGRSGLTLFPQMQLGLLWAGATIPFARSRGVYRTMLHARNEYAKHHRLKHIGLYAVLNTSAPIVAKLGFQPHHRKWYWERPAPTTKNERPPC